MISGPSAAASAAIPTTSPSWTSRRASTTSFRASFRRDRQYFDYDLLGNPNIPSGQTIPIGPSAAPTGRYAWPQVKQSPFLFNTVRRMTDTNLTLFPLSTLTLPLRVFAEHLPGAEPEPQRLQIAGYTTFCSRNIQRNSTDDFTGAIDWKPVQGTQADL